MGMTKMYTGPERRRHPRYRVQKSGLVMAETIGLSATVEIFELSVGGARLLLPPLLHLPDAFEIIYRGEDIVYPSRMIWTRDRIAGIAYTAEPFLREQHQG
jgi:hypothetical protein